MGSAAPPRAYFARALAFFRGAQPPRRGTRRGGRAGRATADNEAPFLRNKKAAVLAAVALREFPQHWPGFVGDVLADDVQAKVELAR